MIRQPVPSPTAAPVPDCAWASGRADGDPLFFAGAGVALLDAACAATHPAAGRCARGRRFKALRPSAKILRLNTREGALRDLRFAVRDAGPAARLLQLWRDLATRPLSIDPGRLAAAAARLDLAVDPNGLVYGLKVCAGEGDSVSAASKSAALAFSAFPDATAADAEILALWVFDLVLAIRLRWGRPAPLIAVKILDPSIRSHGEGGARGQETQLGQTPAQRRSPSPPPRRSTLSAAPPRCLKSRPSSGRNPRKESSSCCWPRIASLPPRRPATRR